MIQCIHTLYLNACALVPWNIHVLFSYFIIIILLLLPKKKKKKKSRNGTEYSVAFRSVPCFSNALGRLVAQLIVVSVWIG